MLKYVFPASKSPTLAEGNGNELPTIDPLVAAGVNGTKDTRIGPGTPGAPSWMWDAVAGADRPVKKTLELIVSAVVSKVATPPPAAGLVCGGVSCGPVKLTVKFIKSACATAKLHRTNTAVSTAEVTAALFMPYSFRVRFAVVGVSKQGNQIGDCTCG